MTRGISTKQLREIARQSGLRDLGPVTVRRDDDGTPVITIGPKEEGMATATQEAPQKLEGLTLDQIRGGIAITLFDETLQTVIANILDERTDPAKARAVRLLVEFYPYVNKDTGEVERRSVDVNVKCDAKLVPVESGGGTLRIQKIGGRNQLALGL